MDKPNEFLNIPERIIVGYNNWGEIPLAYVTYFKGKKIAKETSWNSWRNESIPPGEFENVPTEGFVLNKRAGGYKSGWNYRQSYCRVYDPRGFELEITIDNLLYILQECSCMAGKGLEGKFVYAWEGAQIILLPTTSPDYIATTELTAKREELGLKWKDITPGCTYRTKYEGELIYIGKLSWKYYFGSWKHEEINQTVYHSFWNPVNNELFPINNIKNILYKTEAASISDAAIQKVIGKFKTLPVGKDEVPEEIRIAQPSQQIKDEFNDFFLKKIKPAKSYVGGCYLKTNKKVIIKEYTIEESSRLLGKPKLEIVVLSTITVEIAKNGEIKYSYDTPSYTGYGRREKLDESDISSEMSKLTPVDMGANALYLEVKIGNDWFKYAPYHRLYPYRGNSISLS